MPGALCTWLGALHMVLSELSSPLIDWDLGVAPVQSAASRKPVPPDPAAGESAWPLRMQISL